MPDHRFIRLRADSPECTWAMLDGDGRLIGSVMSGTLAAAAEAIGNERIVVLLPGSHVLPLQAFVPKASPARLRQMTPYLFEESIAEDVERMHFATGRRLDSGQIAVAAIARTRFETWLDALGAAGIAADAIHADTDGVPDTPATLNLVIEGSHVYGRRPGQPPFVLDGVGLPEVCAMLEAQSEDGSDLRYVQIHLDEAAQQEHRSGIAELGARLPNLDVRGLADGALHRLAATVMFEPGPNLLQGRYAPKSNWGERLRPWRVAAGLLLALGLASLAAQAIDYLRLEREDRALTLRLTESCEQTFAAPQLALCANEVRRRLSEAGQTSVAGSESFLNTLAAIAEHRSAGSTIEALSYRNRVMDLRLVVPNVPALDLFAQDIMQTDRFDVRIESTADTEKGIEGRVRVEANAP